MCTHQNNERKQNESQSNFKCNSPSQSTQPAQKTVIRLRRPASKYNSINTESGKKYCGSGRGIFQVIDL